MLQSPGFLQQGVVRLGALLLTAGFAFGQITTTGIHGAVAWKFGMVAGGES